MITNSGIYKIKNIITSDFYIGSAVNLCSRFSTHRGNLGRNCHHNIHLQRAWNKYGVDNFEFSVLELCEKEMTIIREQFYIDNEKPSYNICQVARSSLGVKRSEETRAKISEAQKGEKHYLFGKHLSEKTRVKISEANRGNRGALGHKHTEESRAKMSAARIGTHPSEETRTKLSEVSKGNKSALGHKCTVEARAKMSEAAKKMWMLWREAQNLNKDIL